MSKVGKFISQLPVIRNVRALSYKISPPGFKQLSIGEVFDFYAHALSNSSILERAYSASFKFFMALFPGVIFIITLIPYLPIPNFQTKLLTTLEGIIPWQIYPLLEQTMIDVIKNKNTGLLSLGFLVTVFFSTNGMNGIMRAFNDSAYLKESRNGLKQRLYAAGLTFFNFFVLISTVAIIVFANKYLNALYQYENIGTLIYKILIWAKWLVIFFVLYLMIATIFYFAPAKHLRHNFFSPGAIASTLFAILFTILFTLYINNFSNFNKIYGILGTFPLLLIWIFLNILSLLIGFELNVSIMSAKHSKKPGDKAVTKKKKQSPPPKK